jgi:hypothetical protein
MWTKVQCFYPNTHYCVPDEYKSTQNCLRANADHVDAVINV